MFFSSINNKEVSTSFILPSALLPVMICDPEEKIVQVNDSLCQLLGYAREYLLNKNIFDITFSPDRLGENYLLNFLKNGNIMEYDTLLNFKTESGEVLEALVNITRRFDEEGKYSQRMIRFQRVFKKEESDNFIASKAFKLGEGHHNEHLENLTKSMASSLGTTFVLIASFSENQKISKARLLLHDNQFYENFIFDNKNTPFENGIDSEIFICQDEVVKEYPNIPFFEQYGMKSLLVLPLVDMNNQYIGYIASSGDEPILDRNKASDLMRSFAKRIGIEIEKSNQLQALTESERRYKLVFDHSTDGIIISDYKQNEIIDYNQKVLSLFNIEKDELENITNSLDLSPEFQPDGRKSKAVYEENYSKAFSGGQLHTYKWRFQRKDKSEFDAEVILTPFDRTYDLYRWMVIIRDITERETSEKRAQELKQLRIQEELNLSEREELQTELDYRNRELSSKILLDSQKNNQLTTIRESLQKIIGKVDAATRKEINRLIRDIDRNINLDEDLKKFQLHFEEVHPNFFTKINAEFPDLNPKQLRHCAYIKLGLTSKETAQLLNIAPKSVEMARYRLKKKMSFGSGDRFYEYILSL